MKTMGRREFLKTVVISTGVYSMTGGCLAQQGARIKKRPNILWIMAEDQAKHHLRLYGSDGIATPNIEAMAKDGVVFDHAFCNAPVCSVARSTLITGCYAPRMGTQYHRRLKSVPMPDGLRMFPAYLRDAGYYTTNSTKRDYNCEQAKDVWDKGNAKPDAWRNRPTRNTPFFHVRTTTTTHESKLHFKITDVGSQLKNDPADMKIRPIHPDTDLMRYTYARHKDRCLDVDNETGQIIKMLKDDGVLEDTFIFYFGDNGGCLAGSKGYVFETGLHVPLIVRIPENFKHLCQQKRGGRVSGFVSFVDFSATVLNLAGVKIPALIDGKPFMGPGVKLSHVNKSDQAFGYADRFDELYYRSRTLRKGNFKYIRNYDPFLPYGLKCNYRYIMHAFQQWHGLYQQGKLNPAQAKFFEAKTPEELYDIAADPYETKNLANDPKFAKKLQELRGGLKKIVTDLPDLGILPENVFIEEAASNPIAFGQKNKARIKKYIDIADLMVLPYKEAEPKIKKAFASEDTLDRYWAATVCASFGDEARGLIEIASQLTKDRNLLVRCRAAQFLGMIKAIDPQPVFKQALKESSSGAETLLILNDVVHLRDGGFGYDFNFSLNDVKTQGRQVKRRLKYLNWS